MLAQQQQQRAGRGLAASISNPGTRGSPSDPWGALGFGEGLIVSTACLLLKQVCVVVVVWVGWGDET